MIFPLQIDDLFLGSMLIFRGLEFKKQRPVSSRFFHIFSASHPRFKRRTVSLPRNPMVRENGNGDFELHQWTYQCQTVFALGILDLFLLVIFYGLGFFIPLELVYSDPIGIQKTYFIIPKQLVFFVLVIFYGLGS